MQICFRGPRRGGVQRNLTTEPRRESCPLVNQNNQILNHQKEKVQLGSTETKREKLLMEKAGRNLKMRRKHLGRKSGLQEKHLALRNLERGKINFHAKTLMERETRTKRFRQKVTKASLASRGKVQVESKASHGQKESAELCFSPSFGLWV